MVRWPKLTLPALLLAAVLAGCMRPSPLPAPSATAPTTEATVPETTVSTTAPTEPTVSLTIPGVEIDDVITYFNEVCLDAEFHYDGNPSVIQKWNIPIRYMINGSPTDEDLAVLERFAAWLNTVEGFPGICQTEDPDEANLQIYFCSREELIDRLGNDFEGMDGGVTFWYRENAIYNAIICIRTDIEQYTRNSVILEEIYNGLGPVQDTDLREDSLIYSGFSTPQALHPTDELILKLLYHPFIRCGMNASECEAVIRNLYH